MAIKYSSSMSIQEVESAIKSISTRGAMLDKDIALTGLSVLAHVDKNNEPSLFTKLYNALPKGARSNALIAWAIAFGKIEVNMDKKTSKERPFVVDTSKITDLKGATEKPWFDFKKPKAPADEFNFEAEVAKFQAKVAEWIKKGKVQPSDHLAVGILSAAPKVELAVVEPVAEVVTAAAA